MILDDLTPKESQIPTSVEVPEKDLIAIAKELRSNGITAGMMLCKKACPLTYLIWRRGFILGATVSFVAFALGAALVLLGKYT